MPDTDVLTPDDGIINDEPPEQDDFTPDGDDLDEPELYAGKFKDADALEKGYKELEKFSTQTRQEKAAQDKRIAELEATLATINSSKSSQAEPQPSDEEQINELANEYVENDGISMQSAMRIARNEVETAKLKGELLSLKGDVGRQISNVAGNSVFEEAINSVGVVAGVENKEIIDYIKANIPTEQFINASPENKAQFVKLATGAILYDRVKDGSLGKPKVPPAQDPPGLGGSNQGQGKLSQEIAEVKRLFPEFTQEQAERTAKEWRDNK